MLEQIKSVIFWVVAAIIGLIATLPNANAQAQIVTAAVISSDPWHGNSRSFTKKCFGGEANECKYVGADPEYFKTTFQGNGYQFTILTHVQMPVDVWFDVTRSCSNGDCEYLKARPSKYQSPESLAIQEILLKEQIRYVTDPHRLY